MKEIVLYLISYIFVLSLVLNMESQFILDREIIS